MKKKLFDVKILIIILSIIILGTVAFYFGIKKAESKYKMFANDGYIIANSNKSGVSNKYYFNGNTKYKTNYDDTISLTDTSNKKININNDSFIHYSNDNIGTTKKSVILNLNELENTVLKYYNFYSDTILNNKSGIYNLKLYNGELSLNDFIIKISENKYMIVSPNMELNISDEKHVIQNYIELNFLEGNIVRIENNENVFQNISTDMKLKINDSISIDLSNRNIINGDKTIVNLNQITIESDDNIDIPNNATTTTTRTTKGINVTTTKKISNSTSQNGYVDETEIEENVKVLEPTFNVYNLKVTTYSMTCMLGVDDPNNIINGSINVKVIESNTGKEIANLSETSWFYDITFETKKLNSNTDYTLIVTANINKDGTEYTKNYVQKTFRTESLGVNVVKDYFTENEMHFKVSKDQYSDVKSATAILSDLKGNPISTVDLSFENGETDIDFQNLSNNTSYTLTITNFDYYGIDVVNEDIIISTYKTLKIKPTSTSLSGNFGDTNFTINKKDGIFTLSYDNIKDPDSGIIEYRYDIYENLNTTKPIKSITSKNRDNIKVYVDESSLERNKDYVYKVTIIFNDNEKTIEYVSGLSETMNIDGTKVPTLKFQKEEVTYNKISGYIIIEDTDLVIDETKRITVAFKDSYGNTEYITYNDLSNNNKNDKTYTLPVYKDRLTNDTMYMFEVTASVKFSNETIYESYQIGTVYVKTEPTIVFRAEWNKDLDKTGSSTSYCSNRFNVGLTLKSTIDLNTEELKTAFNNQIASIGSIRLSVIDPSTNQTIVNVTLSQNLEDLKEGKTLSIKPNTFYSSGAENYFTKEKYIIVLSTIIDENNENEFELLESSKQIDFFTCINQITDYKELLEAGPINVNEKTVTEEIQLGNETKETEKVSLGYTVTPKFMNNYQLVESITYYAYDINDSNNYMSKTIKKSDPLFQTENPTILPSYTFLFDDANNLWFKRGGKYEFSYELKVAIIQNSVKKYTCSYPSYQVEQERLEIQEGDIFSQLSSCEAVTQTSTSNNNNKYNIDLLEKFSNNYKVNLLDNINDETPNDSSKTFKSQIYYPFKRKPYIYLYPIGLEEYNTSLSDEENNCKDTITGKCYHFSYNIIDYDNVLYDTNINNSILHYNTKLVPIETTKTWTSDFKDLYLPFKDLQNNILNLSVNYSLTSNISDTLYNTNNILYDSIPTKIIDSESLNYEFSYDVVGTQYVKITFNENSYVNKLVKLDTIFHDENSNTHDTDVTIKNISINSDSYKIKYDNETKKYYYIIPLANLSSLIGKTIQTSVKIYYDSGEYGYDFINNKYIDNEQLYALKYKNEDTYIYCTRNITDINCNDNPKTYNLNANGSIFNVLSTSNITYTTHPTMIFKDKILNKSLTMTSNLGGYGYSSLLDNNTNRLNIFPMKIKNVEKQVLSSDKQSSTFTFDSTTPIYLLYDINVSPISANMTYKIAGISSTETQKIYYEIAPGSITDFQTAEKKTKEFTVDNNVSTETLLDLISIYGNTDFKNTNNKFTFKVYYNDSKGNKVYLYNSQGAGEFYTTFTLSDYYKITGGNIAVNSSLDSTGNVVRKLEFDYTIDIPIGFDSIKYEIYNENDLTTPIIIGTDDVNTGTKRYEKSITLNNNFISSSTGIKYRVYVKPYKKSISNISLASEDSYLTYTFFNYSQPGYSVSKKSITGTTLSIDFTAAFIDPNYVIKNHSYNIKVLEKESQQLLFNENNCNSLIVSTKNVNVLSFLKEYIVRLTYLTDTNNDGIYETQTSDEVIEKGNVYGISFGDISVSVESGSPVLNFYKSDQINKISRVDYTFTNLNSDGSQHVIAQNSNKKYTIKYDSANNFYSMPINDVNVTSYSNFYITIQFFAGDELSQEPIYNYSGIYTRSS